MLVYHELANFGHLSTQLNTLMQRLLYRGLLLFIATSCGTHLLAQHKKNMDRSESTLTTEAQNPLLARWTGPYNGVPPLDQVKVSFFRPALEAAMAENLREVANKEWIRGG